MQSKENTIKKLFLILIFILITSPVFSWDGEVYFGKYWATNEPRLVEYDEWDDPVVNKGGEGVPFFISSVEIAHDIQLPKLPFEYRGKSFFPKLRPYVALTTEMDKKTGWMFFHPSHIGYYTGVELEIYDGAYLGLEHLCHHPVDTRGIVDKYNLIKVGWKFNRK